MMANKNLSFCRYGDCDIVEWPYGSGNFSCPFTKVQKLAFKS